MEPNNSQKQCGGLMICKYSYANYTVLGELTKH